MGRIGVSVRVSNIASEAMGRFSIDVTPHFLASLSRSTGLVNVGREKASVTLEMYLLSYSVIFNVEPEQFELVLQFSHLDEFIHLEQ